jgi:uncharacterized protein with NRDE domain
MSRGYLVSYFLQHPRPSTVQQEIDALISSDLKFAGFNLLLFTPSASQGLSYDATLLTNGGGGNPITSRPATLTERRCGALSNGVDGDEFPKIKHGVMGLNNILTRDTASDDMALAEDLFELLL